MARILITGSADGLGQLSAKALINLRHQIVLHARNEERAKQALKNLPGAEDVLIADLSSIDETKELAANANASGEFDVIIHNAAIYNVTKAVAGAASLPEIFVVNTLAPYILTCLIKRPKRLIYLSSDMHLQGDANLASVTVRKENSSPHISYSDTKLHDLILSMAVARKWAEVYSNAVTPGWVPTKMGGAGAPDNLEKGFQTQVWLAVSNDREAKVSGCYFYHKRQTRYLHAAKDPAVQEKFLALCEQFTSVPFPVQASSQSV
jgi:NAD(P)-dependent dehydrogenase (short-subunit alcohol dehydrogenase family)